MAPIKVNLPDKDTRQKIINAGGGEPTLNTVTSSPYAASTVAVTPLTKTAQFSGSGANVIFTQPMFFSPLHTPQSWQIASKRREISQWLITSGCISTYDYTFKDIEDFLFHADEVVEDTLTGGLLYENIESESILAAKGKLSKPTRFAVRDCKNKRCFSFSAYGYWRGVDVSEEHPLVVLDGKMYRHKRKLEKDATWRRSKGIQEGGDKPCIKFLNNLIFQKEAQNVDKDDFLLFPVSNCGETVLDKDIAWLVGNCIADGTISNKRARGYRVSFTINKNEYIRPTLEKKLQLVTAGKVSSSPHGDGDGWRVGVSTKQSWSLFTKYITGKRTKKKFLADIFELDRESRLHVLGGYLDGDGCFHKSKLIASNYSCDMADQLYAMLLSVGISASLTKYPLYGEHYKTDSKWCYKIHIPSSEIPKIQPYMRSNKIPDSFEPKTTRQLRFFYEEDGTKYLAQPISEIKEFTYTGKGYDLQIDPERAFVASGYVVSNCRFYYCFTPDNYVLMADGTEKRIEDIVDGDKIINGKGEVDNVKSVHKRFTSDNILEIQISGNNRRIKTTYGHEIPRVTKEDWYKSHLTTFSEKQKRERRRDFGDFQLEKKWGEAVTLIKGDRLVCSDGTHRAIVDIKPSFYSGYVYDLEIENEHSYCVNRCVVHNSNDTKIAAGVDFYSYFPITNFKLESKSKKTVKFYEQVVEKLDLPEWLSYISHEYYLLGDVFPFLEIACSHCNGSAVKEDGSECLHEDGMFGRIVLMNPDYIEVQTNVLAEEPVIALMPDEELRMLVQRREPKQIYDRLPPRLLDLVASGRPIPLSNRSISHIKHNASSYATYSEPLLRRMFQVLAYKTKIMTANWIVAERMILPIRIVKVGDKDRPASEEDLANVQSQLANVANDPNLTLVTHHAFEYSWEGVTGKIHNITSELENIGKEILDGFMLNQALLNGEAGGYASSQVGVEVLLKRLEIWQQKLAKWVEKKIFLPIAMMQGFIDEEASEELGDTVYLYPTLKWDDLRLRDKSNMLQLYLQLYDKALMSGQTLCEEFELDYDIEQERLREESLVAMQSGQLMPAGAGGAMGGMGGMPMGGAPPMGGGAPLEGPGMGGPQIPGVPGAELGGASGMGGVPGMAPTASGLQITKRGKGGKQEEPEPVQMKTIRLTKLEQKMYKMLSGLNVPYALFGQYQVKLPGQQQPFMLDFAYPEIGVGTECLHPDTWVPTIEGAKQAKDIEVGENLIGRDGTAVNVKRRFINNSKGKLLKIKAHGMLPIKVTPNHPILICKPEQGRIHRNNRFGKDWTRIYTVPGQPYFVNASELELGDFLVIPKERSIAENISHLDLSEYRGRSHNAISLPERIEINDDVAWLLGMYAAEGCSVFAYKNGKIKSGNVTFSFNIDETEYIEKTQKILYNVFNLLSSTYVNLEHNCIRVNCSCYALARFFRDNFGHKAPKKKLPSWLFAMDVEFKQSFMKAFCLGDGCFRGKVDRHISSSAKMLIDMQALAFSSGCFATLCRSRREGVLSTLPGGTYETAGLWEMGINQDIKLKQYREDDDYYYVPVRKISEVKYNGPVINFETSGNDKADHTYLVLNLVTHNCDGALWHEREDLKERDSMRDQKLANVGWRILRFREEAIDEHMDTIRDIVYKNIVEAADSLKKAAENDNGQLDKMASIIRFTDKVPENNIAVALQDLDDNLGLQFLIGEPVNDSI